MKKMQVSWRGAMTLGALVLTTGSWAQALFFNASAPANNAVTRSNWLAAIGVAAPQYYEDFEGVPLNTNLHGIPGVLYDGLVVYDTSVAHAAYVRGSSSYFGGSSPIGTRAVAHNERAWLEFDFSASPVDYIGGYSIDHTGAVTRVTFTDDTTQDFSLGGGSAAEFYGIYRNNRPRIKRVQFDAGGDGEWGQDDLQYGIVPEPAGALALALGLAFLRRRRSVR